MGQILLGLARLQLTLATHSWPDPGSAPLMTDPRALALLDLIRAVCTPAFMASPNLIPLLAFTITDLTARRGVAPVSGWGIGAYGFVLLGPLGLMERGLRLADLSAALQACFSDEGRASGAFLHYAFFHHWRAPLAQAVPVLEETARAALDLGDLDGVFLCRQIAGLTASFCGMAVPAQLELLQETERLARRFRRGWYHESNAMRLHALWRLSGEGQVPKDFDGAPWDPEERLARWAATGDRTCIAMQHIHDAFVCYILGDRAESLASSRAVRPFIDALVGTFYVPMHELLLALGLTWAARQEEGPRGPLLRQARRLARRLAGYVPRAPQNFLAMERLLEAELLRGHGRPHEAIPAYEEAGRIAQEYGFAWLFALASELEAEVLAETGSERLAREVGWEAFYTWQRQGATAKARRFVAEHHGLGRLVAARSAASSAAAIPPQSSGHSSAGHRPDLDAVLEDCLVLSGQLALSDLLDRAMSTVLQNSAARRGLLLVPRGGGWCVEVEQDLRAGVASTEGSARYAREVVQYVARTGQPVVLGDSATATAFTTDPWLRGGPPRCVLCLPLEHRGRQIGVLYLENDEITHAFSEGRVKALGLLCRQLAISIENARLFADQERLAHASGRFVPKELLGLLGRPGAADASLGDRREQEMTVLCVGTGGLPTQDDGLEPAQALALVSELLAVVEPVCVRHRGVVYRRASGGLTALFPTGADDALDAALNIAQSLDGLITRRSGLGLPPVRVGMGIDAGPVLIGIVGSPDRLDAAAISAAVENASWAAGLARALGAQVLISDRARGRLRHSGHRALRTVGQLRSDAGGALLALLEVLDAEPPASRELKVLTRGQLLEALQAFQRGELATAGELLAQVLRRDPADRVAAHHLARCRDAGGSGAPAA